MKKYFALIAMVLIGAGVASGQPSTRLRLTQIQDAPDTNAMYFIAAGLNDTIVYKADILSIDSTGRVFTLVVGTDTVRWEDTGGAVENIYTDNGTISGHRTVAIANTPFSSLTFQIDSAHVSAAYWTVWIYDPGFATYDSRIQTTRGGTYIKSKENRIDILNSGLDIERSGAGTFTITDNAPTATGIQYAADYSANYTNRSLVDKEYVDNAGGGAFSTTLNVTSNSPGTLGTDDFVFGSGVLDDDGNSAHDARFLFDKSKAAFRAGTVSSTQWDDSSRGFYSSAFGINTTATAIYSFAANNSSDATGIASTSFGSNNTASGSYSFTAGGSVNTASGSGAITLGGASLVASGNYSVAAGTSATSDKRGQFSISDGPGFLAQYSTLTAGVEITGKGSAALAIGGGGGLISIPENTSWLFQADVSITIHVAGTGGSVSTGETAAYMVRGVLVNNSGTVTLSTSSNEYTYEPASMAGGTLTVSADNINDALLISFDPDNTAWAPDTKTRCYTSIRLTQISF